MRATLLVVAFLLAATASAPVASAGAPVLDCPNPPVEFVACVVKFVADEAGDEADYLAEQAGKGVGIVVGAAVALVILACETVTGNPCLFPCALEPRACEDDRFETALLLA